MHKKTAKNHRLTNKWSAREPGGPTNMTVLQRQRASDRNFSTGPTSSRAASEKARLSVGDRYWDDNGQLPDRGSWSEDIEDMGSRRTLEQWDLVERTLHDEGDQLAPGPLFDECLHWRNVLPHLRVIGRASTPILQDREGRSGTTVGSKESSTTSKKAEKCGQNPKRNEFSGLQSDSFSKDLNRTSNNQSRQQAKEEVLDHMVDFICKELAELEAEKDAEDLEDNFSKYLKISPAPTCVGKNPLNSNNFYYNVENVDTAIKANGTKESKKEKVTDKDQSSEIRRNKLGTVFNERIIVSPEPFVVTTRESFSTLRRTPIHFLGESYDFANDIGSGSRRDNSRRKLSLTRKTPLLPTSHIQTSWNTPLCPTIWSKNIKLTPIDTSRLPSSKRRPSKTAESIFPRPNRNALSPISRSAQPSSSNNGFPDNCITSLEIRGSQIVAQENKRTIARRKLGCIKRVKG